MSENSEHEFDPFEVQPEKKGNTGATIAWLAMVVALAAIVFAGWQWWTNRPDAEETARRQEALENVQSALASLEGDARSLNERLDELDAAQLAAQVDDLRSRLQRIGNESSADLTRLASVEEALEKQRRRIAALEEALAAVVVRGESAGKRLELTELEYLLRTASERLLLFGDVRAAARALALADEQLEALDDPVYLPVRQAIAAALLELEAMPQVEYIELTETLSDLQERIPSLPFPGEAGGSDTEVPDGEEAQGVWQRFKATMAGLVTVRRRVSEDELISIGDREYLRQGLWLQLESARLALMRGDEALYRSGLQRARETLERYFDADDAGVELASATIERLSRAELTVEAPDISEPWLRLKRLRTVREAVAEPAAEAVEPAAAGEPEAGDEAQ